MVDLSNDSSNQTPSAPPFEAVPITSVWGALLQGGMVERLAGALQWGPPILSSGGAITQWPGLGAACNLLGRLVKRPLRMVRPPALGVFCLSSGRQLAAWPLSGLEALRRRGRPLKLK